jgi:hypothetical protein
MRAYTCNLIQAECWDDDTFQDYYDEDGNRIPAGEDIGVEIYFPLDDEPILYLLDGIYFPG